MRVAMLRPPSSPPCGVADYSIHLAAALKPLVDLSVLDSADEFVQASTRQQIGHIQHQYSLFGGVAPWRATFSRLLKEVRSPVVITAHEFVEPTGSLPRRIAIRMTNRVHFGSPRILRTMVHTEHDKQMLQSVCANPDGVVVVRHGIPAPFNLPSRSDSRLALGVGDRRVAVLLGFIARNKGHLTAIEALRALPLDTMLAIVGGKHPSDQTTYLEEVTAKIIEAKLTNRVVITGYLEPQELAQWLAASDIVLAPFAHSSGSGTLSLALSSGQPILASNIPAHQEIVSVSPGCIALCDATSPQPLADAMGSLLGDPDRREVLRAAARRHAETWTYARMASETVRVYADALEAAS